MSRALDLAERAVRAAEGDEADASVHVERSGFARFAASAVHQPTLIRDESVTSAGRARRPRRVRDDEPDRRGRPRRGRQARGRGRRALAGRPGLPGPRTTGRRARGRGLRRGDGRPDARGPGRAGRRGDRRRPRASGSTATTRAAATEVGVASTTGHAVSQATTDVERPHARGRRGRLRLRRGDLLARVRDRPGRRRPRGCREGGPHEGRRADRAGDVSRRARALRDLGAPLLLRLHLAQRARPPRGPQLPVRPPRREALRRRLHALGRRARPARLSEGIRPRGRPQAARAHGRGGRGPRRRLGPPYREAG